MTVDVLQADKITGAGNGVATVFSFSDMVIYASTDLQVTHVSSAGVETLLVEGTGASNYSVAVSLYPGTGSITYPADAVTPMASGESVVMKSVLPLEQELNLENQGGYNPDLQEIQFDKLLGISKQIQEALDRSLKLPVSYTGGVSTDTPAPDTASRYLRVNAALTALEWAAISTAVASATSNAPLAGAIAASVGVGSDFARDDHVHPQTFIKGGALVGADPVVVDTDGRYFHLSGSVNFASMTVAANRLFIVEFDGTPTMTHHATNLDLPGEANILAVAGDRMLCYSTGANTVHVLAYFRKDGTPIAIADNSITLAKMAGGTDGQFHTFDANGDPVVFGPGTAGQVPTSNGPGAAPTMQSSYKVALAAVQSTSSGSSVTFGSIPANTFRITLMFEEVKLTAGAHIDVTIGDAGGLEASGYVSTSTQETGTGVVASTTEFIMYHDTASNTISGHMVLTLKDAANFTWVSSHNVKNSTATVVNGGGHKSLSAELTQVNIGGGTFDGGSISAMYEYTS